MAEKVVSVRLQARVEGFTAGMRKAKASVDDLTKADVPKAARGYKDLADKAALAGAAVAVGLGVAVKRFADFDSAMSAVKANVGGTAEEMDRLREAALQLGADSQFSATEAAQGINELGKAGVQTADILGGGLKGALDLAAAGQISVASAAETTASAMTQFGLQGDDAVRVADLLANGANKAQGGVGDLGAALGQAGLVAAATGLSVEETAAGLTAFASAGLIGSDAGTSFKTMLQRLTPQSEAAAAAMEEVGLKAYDSQGNFIGLAAVAGQLQTGMANLTQEQRNAAMQTIFGSDAIRASNILYREGAQGIRTWTDEVSVQGAAAAQAAALTDNLRGDIERLGGAFDSVLIGTGSGANESLRVLTQGLEGVVEGVGRIPGPLLLAGAGLTAIALGVPKGISAFRTYSATLDSVGLSFDKIAARGPRAEKAINGVTKAGKGLGILAATLAAGGALDAIFGDDTARPGADVLIRDLIGAEDAVAAFSDRMERFADESSNWWASNRVTNYGDAINDVFNPSAAQKVDNFAGSLTSVFGIDNNSDIANAGAALKDLDGVLSGLVSSGNAEEADRLFRQFAEASGLSGDAAAKLMTKLPGYDGLLAGVNNSAKLAAGSSGDLAESTEDLKTQAEEADDALSALKDAIDGLGSPAAQARAAQRDFQSAINDTDDALGTYRDSLIAKAIEDGKGEKAAAAWADAQIEAGKALKGTSDEALAVQSSLDAIRQATLDKVLADYELTGSTETATAAMQRGRDEFVNAATEAGMTKKAAEELATQLGLIPEDVSILVSQSGADTAAAQISRAAVDRTSTIWVTRKFRGSDLSSDFQGVGGRAGGGPIWGPGTKTSDSVPIWASQGEFMQKAAAVDKYGYGFMEAVNSLRFPVELARGLARGGPVTPQYAPPSPYLSMPSMGPASISETNNAPLNIIGGQFGPTIDDIRREEARERRRNSLSPSGAR